MNNKESLSKLVEILKEGLKDKGLSFSLHRPEVDVIDNKYFNMVKSVQEILNNE